MRPNQSRHRTTYTTVGGLNQSDLHPESSVPCHDRGMGTAGAGDDFDRTVANALVDELLTDLRSFAFHSGGGRAATRTTLSELAETVEIAPSTVSSSARSPGLAAPGRARSCRRAVARPSSRGLARCGRGARSRRRPGCQGSLGPARVSETSLSRRRTCRSSGYLAREVPTEHLLHVLLGDWVGHDHAALLPILLTSALVGLR